MARVHGAEMKRRSSHELSGLVMSLDRYGLDQFELFNQALASQSCNPP